jgi:hypothetical protein
MTPIEEKSLNAQITLSKEIITIDNMILHLVQNHVNDVFTKIIQPKTYDIKSDQDKVEFTVDEFKKIKTVLEELKDEKGLVNINSWIDRDYLAPKEEKMKILSLLNGK